MEQSKNLSLSISIVCYQQSSDELKNTLAHLSQAISQANNQLNKLKVSFDLLDNSEDSRWFSLFDSFQQSNNIECRYKALPHNPGFSAGHNLALMRSEARYHLIVNPDLFLEADALSVAIHYMEQHAESVLVSPRVFNQVGDEEYLLKRYPSVLTLALRGFAPRFVKGVFKRQLAYYEMRDIARDQIKDSGLEICSGCCLLFRADVAREIGGFDEQFFLYFEDFDFCLRMAKKGSLVYLPDMKAVHLGGYASSKGLRHIGMFVRSARKFFQKHGWKWI